MTDADKIAGLAILRSYMKSNDYLEREGFACYVRVLYEELSEDDAAKLDKLGWGAVDDYVGYEEDNEFNKTFYEWFDKQDWMGYDVSVEMLKLVEDMAKNAMFCGVSIGMMDKVLTDEAMKAGR